jgi:hypothetical protein
MVEYLKDGYKFIAPSNRKGKKYDVYVGDKYITSFGAFGMEQYFDKISHYREDDHRDKKRLKQFNHRFGSIIAKSDKNSPMYFSSKYLW